MGTMDDVMKDGISFTNKRNWKKDDVVEEVKVEPEEPKEPDAKASKAALGSFSGVCATA